MALYHVHVHVIRKGPSRGGAAHFARYIAREEREPEAREAPATRTVRYIHRERYAKDDLVEKGVSASMPDWAQGDAAHFFQMADQYERKRGCVARCFDIALPRELSPAQRSDLAAAIRAAYFDPFPHAYAIHNPIDPPGRRITDPVLRQPYEHPHMHLMLSERRETDGGARGPELYFKRAATRGQDPETHGVAKDTAFQGPDRLREIRAGIAVLTNAALEMAGHGIAVSHESLTARGLGREVHRYHETHDRARVVAHRQEQEPLRQWEQGWDAVQWAQYVRDEGLHDLSRAAVVAHVQQRTQDPQWLKDMARTVERAPQRPGGRVLTPGYEADTPGAGVHVQLEEREYSYGR